MEKIDLTHLPDPVTGDVGPSEPAFEMRWPAHGYPGVFRLVRSVQSGLLFNSPRLPPDALERLYDANYYFFHRHPRGELRRNAQLYARTLKPLGDTLLRDLPDGRTLDVGCARGYLPAILNGLGRRCRGVEISPTAADYARARLGVDVFTGTIEAFAATEPDPFPLVTACDVIEHVPDPAAFAAALSHVVAPGGLLVVVTPNARSGNITVRVTKWHGFNPYHIYLFDADNLSAMLARFGFETVDAWTYKNTPVDAPGGEPRARKIRNAAADTLAKLGLLRPAFTGYYALQKRLTGDADPAAYLAEALDLARTLPPHPRTPDAAAPLAAGLRGDDLVLVARRR